MQRKQKCIYVCAGYSVFNVKNVHQFENLTNEDSVYLYSNLMANYFDIFDELNDEIETVYYLDVTDNNYLPPNFFSVKSKIFFGTGENINYNIELLDQNYFSHFENNLLIRLAAIGISNQNIKKIFDLLAIEDDTLVIGRSTKNKVAFIGFNKIDRKLMTKLIDVDFDYEKFLPEAGKRELYINTLDGFQLIENFNDLKNLYIELSKKESEAYCKQESHERFTNLFIEYRDLLR